MKQEIQHFNGSEQQFKMPLFRTRYTEGISFVGRKASWLVTDVLSIVEHHPRVRRHPFVSVHITVLDNKAVFKYTDGNENTLFTQRYKYTDLDDIELTLFATNGVLMLAGEY